MRHAGRLAGAAVVLLCGASARAADDVVQLEEQQVTASRSEAAAGEVAQAVTVVTRAQIERESPQTWTDLLRGQAGAFTQASGPGQGIVIVRGLKGSEVLHLVDGMRLNNAFFRDAPNQYLSLVDAYAVERIEVQHELVRGSIDRRHPRDEHGQDQERADLHDELQAVRHALRAARRAARGRQGSRPARA